MNVAELHVNVELSFLFAVPTTDNRSTYRGLSALLLLVVEFVVALDYVQDAKKHDLELIERYTTIRP